jgi:hypothetical protein
MRTPQNKSEARPAPSQPANAKPPDIAINESCAPAEAGAHNKLIPLSNRN